MLKELHWLPIRYRILYKLSLLVFKCVNNIGQVYLKELLIRKKAPRTLRLAELSLPEIPRVRTETFGKSFAFGYATPYTWNSLPLHIRQSKDITIFKKAVKLIFSNKHLISKYLFQCKYCNFSELHCKFEVILT